MLWPLKILICRIWGAARHQEFSKLPQVILIWSQHWEPQLQTPSWTEPGPFARKILALLRVGRANAPFQSPTRATQGTWSWILDVKVSLAKCKDSVSKNRNRYSLGSTSFVPSTVTNALCTLLHLNLSSTLWGMHYYFSPFPRWRPRIYILSQVCVAPRGRTRFHHGLVQSLSF